LIVLSKSLKPLPVVKREDDGTIHDGFTDPELRYRQRYVDLTVNPAYKQIFINRSKVISSMRNYFNARAGWKLKPRYCNPYMVARRHVRLLRTIIRLDMPLFLRIANELYLKRLIVAGFDGVYEFGKMFRNEGMDRTHNPEFTAMEIYVAYKDYIWMMAMVEECLETVAKAVHGIPVVQVGSNEINFAGPYEKYRCMILS
jgi:lysyl-tRNA synthetase class 2